MYSGNNNARKLLLGVLLLAAVFVPTLHAQYAQIDIDFIEQGLYSSLSYVPQNEYHKVFQNFVKERYKGRSWLYDWEAGDFAQSFGRYVEFSGVFKKYEAEAQAARQKEAAAAEATRQREAAAKAEAAKYTHRLTAATKLYAAQDFSSAVVAALTKGTRMAVEEYGEYTDLDGDTAKWARVKTISGQTGWVFSGYLENVPK